MDSTISLDKKSQSNTNCDLIVNFVFDMQWINDNKTNNYKNTIAKGQQDKQWQTIKWLKDNRKNNDRQCNG